MFAGVSSLVATVLGEYANKPCWQLIRLLTLKLNDIFTFRLKDVDIHGGCSSSKALKVPIWSTILLDWWSWEWWELKMVKLLEVSKRASLPPGPLSMSVVVVVSCQCKSQLARLAPFDRNQSHRLLGVVRPVWPSWHLASCTPRSPPVV